MNKELINMLDIWKAEDEFHKPAKAYNYKPSPVKQGEFIIEIKKSVKINFINESTIVSVIKKMHTHCHVHDDNFINPNGDKIVLAKLTKQVDDEFLSKYLNAEDDLIQKVLPDGFF